MARCYDGFGNLADGRPIWSGNFETSGFADRNMLFYSPGDHNWWLASFSPAGAMTWRLVGNTAGFGNLHDGRPIWIADFNGGGTEDVLFYYPGDHNWWLGTLPPGGQLSWQHVGNTAGFGNVADGRPFWIEDFTGGGGKDVLFYYPGDHNWWLGSISGGALTWQNVGNTVGFGNLADGRPIWIGYFSNFTRPEVLFHVPRDGNWWLGSFSPGGASLTWRSAGNSAGFGNIWDGRPFWIEDFDADARSNVLFHDPRDGSWWLGTFSTAGALTWRGVGNTASMGAVWPNGRFWTGFFRGVFKPDLLYYDPTGGDWRLGTLTGSQIAWQLVGNTVGFGNLHDRPFWTGYFKGSGGFDALFYAGDGNWWLGSISGNTLGWTLAGNTGRSYEGRLRVHYKLLANPTTSLATHHQAMKDLFADHDILVELGTTEDLTAPNPALDDLRDLDVGNCMQWIAPFSSTTPEQSTLFFNRANVPADELVIYVCRTLTSPDGSTIGCASHPHGWPGCVIERTVTRFVASHEIGHLLGLGHVNDADRLMNPDDGWTNLPPDLLANEGHRMRGSGFVKGC